MVRFVRCRESPEVGMQRKREGNTHKCGGNQGRNGPAAWYVERCRIHALTYTAPTHAYTYAHPKTYPHPHTRAHIHTYTPLTHAHVHTHAHFHTRAHIRTYTPLTHAHVHTCIHTLTLVHIYTHLGSRCPPGLLAVPGPPFAPAPRSLPPSSSLQPRAEGEAGAEAGVGVPHPFPWVSQPQQPGRGPELWPGTPSPWTWMPLLPLRCPARPRVPLMAVAAAGQGMGQLRRWVRSGARSRTHLGPGCVGGWWGRLGVLAQTVGSPWGSCWACSGAS
jgi:hypothetical protein